VAARRRERDEESKRWHTWHSYALPKGRKPTSFKDFVRPAAPAPALSKQRRQDPVHQIEALRGILSRRKR